MNINLDKFRKHKKWEELTDKEKLEYLKMEQEDTTHIEWRHLLFMVGLVLTALAWMHISLMKAQISDLYVQNGITPSMNVTVQETTMLQEIGNMALPMNIAFLALTILLLGGAVHHVLKWKKFNKSIRREKK